MRISDWSSDLCSSHLRANLHAMATLYLCRGIALLDARDDLTASSLTETEQFCLDQRQAGLCDLDIAEALDRSVQAVKVHVQRARRQQAAYTGRESCGERGCKYGETLEMAEAKK